MIKTDSDDNVQAFSGKGDDVMDKTVKVIRGLQGDEKLREEARIRRNFSLQKKDVLKRISRTIF